MELIKPGLFSVNVAADFRRAEFDEKNEIIVGNNVPVDYVFIGDSITQAFYLNAYFSGNGRRFVNRGIGGDVPYYAARRFEADVVQLRPSCCVYLCGINETWSLEGLEGSEAYYAGIDEIINKILAPAEDIIKMCETAGIRLAVCSMLPTYGHVTKMSKDRNDLILSVNKSLRELAGRREGLLYVDYHRGLTDSGGRTLRRELSPDGCHLNRLGYNILAEILTDCLTEKGWWF